MLMVPAHQESFPRKNFGRDPISLILGVGQGKQFVNNETNKYNGPISQGLPSRMLDQATMTIL